jgi:glycosyltransferase involved in cell wall biosynthesis
MRVLWITGAMNVGGAERAMLQVLGGLSDRGHEVDALMPAGAAVGALASAAGLEPRTAPLGGMFRPAARRAIRGALGRERYDVALVSTLPEWVPATLVRRRPTRLVLWRHMALRLPWTMRCLADRRADAVIAPSEAVRRSLLGRMGVRPERLHVLANPVRFAIRERVPDGEERRALRTSLGLSPSGRWIGFFGGWNRRKGIADVLEVVRTLRSRLGDVRLLVRGPACALPSEDGGGAFVHFLDDAERVAEAMTSVDVVLLATHESLREASSLTIIEAMACGTPVAAYATGGVPEVIGEDGMAGRLARPDDPADLARVVLETLLDAPAAKARAEAGLARVRRLFAPAPIVESCERLLSSLCESRAR